MWNVLMRELRVRARLFLALNAILAGQSRIVHAQSCDAIRFAVALTNDWNGRFLFQGGGGLNGSVNPPIGNQAAGERAALSRGFAVISTDTGHQGTGGFDASFRQDQRAALDFAYQAIGRVAQLGKLLVAELCSRPADYAYFVGCSTGGREAMLMSQRYP